MYCIQRDWGEEYTYGVPTTRWFSTDELKTLYTTLQYDSGSEFAEFITGMNTDEYADTACECMADEFRETSQFYKSEPGCHFDSVFDVLENCQYWLTCYTFFRCMNLFNLTDEQAQKEWLDSSRCTLEGMLEHNKETESGLETLYWDEDNDVTPTLDVMVSLYKKDNKLV